jgi:hypothetical protein
LLPAVKIFPPTLPFFSVIWSWDERRLLTVFLWITLSWLVKKSEERNIFFLLVLQFIFAGLTAGRTNYTTWKIFAE